jgi:hypothetical protein
VVNVLAALPGIDYNHENNEVCVCMREMMYLVPTHLFMRLKFVWFTIVSGLLPQDDTALICASTNGHVEVVKLLLVSPGIDYNHENNEVCVYERDDVFGSNPLIYALEICVVHNCVGFVTTEQHCTYPCKC